MTRAITRACPHAQKSRANAGGCTRNQRNDPPIPPRCDITHDTIVPRGSRVARCDGPSVVVVSVAVSVAVSVSRSFARTGWWVR